MESQECLQPSEQLPHNKIAQIHSGVECTHSADHRQPLLLVQVSQCSSLPCCPAPAILLERAAC
jgi:hypothetical protein